MATSLQDQVTLLRQQAAKKAALADATELKKQALQLHTGRLYPEDILSGDTVKINGQQRELYSPGFQAFQVNPNAKLDPEAFAAQQRALQLASSGQQIGAEQIKNQGELSRKTVLENLIRGGKQATDGSFAVQFRNALDGSGQLELYGADKSNPLAGLNTPETNVNFGNDITNAQGQNAYAQADKAAVSGLLPQVNTDFLKLQTPVDLASTLLSTAANIEGSIAQFLIDIPEFFATAGSGSTKKILTKLKYGQSLTEKELAEAKTFEFLLEKQTIEDFNKLSTTVGDGFKFAADIVKTDRVKAAQEKLYKQLGDSVDNGTFASQMLSNLVGNPLGTISSISESIPFMLAAGSKVTSLPFAIQFTAENYRAGLDLYKKTYKDTPDVAEKALILAGAAFIAALNSKVAKFVTGEALVGNLSSRLMRTTIGKFISQTATQLGAKLVPKESNRLAGFLLKAAKVSTRIATAGASEFVEEGVEPLVTAASVSPEKLSINKKNFGFSKNTIKEAKIGGAIGFASGASINTSLSAVRSTAKALLKTGDNAQKDLQQRLIDAANSETPPTPTADVQATVSDNSSAPAISFSTTIGSTTIDIPDNYDPLVEAIKGPETADKAGIEAALLHAANVIAVTISLTDEQLATEKGKKYEAASNEMSNLIGEYKNGLAAIAEQELETANSKQDKKDILENVFFGSDAPPTDGNIVDKLLNEVENLRDQFSPEQLKRLDTIKANQQAQKTAEQNVIAANKAQSDKSKNGKRPGDDDFQGDLTSVANDLINGKVRDDGTIERRGAKQFRESLLQKAAAKSVRSFQKELLLLDHLIARAEKFFTDGKVNSLEFGNSLRAEIELFTTIRNEATDALERSTGIKGGVGPTGSSAASTAGSTTPTPQAGSTETPPPTPPPPSGTTVVEPADPKKEFEGKTKRELEVVIQRMEGEQATRQKLLVDPTAMKAKADEAGLSVKEMTKLTANNFNNAASILTAAKKAVTNATNPNTTTGDLASEEAALVEINAVIQARLDSTTEPNNAYKDQDQETLQKLRKNIEDNITKLKAELSPSVTGESEIAGDPEFKIPDDATEEEKPLYEKALLKSITVLRRLINKDNIDELTKTISRRVLDFKDRITASNPNLTSTLVPREDSEVNQAKFDPQTIRENFYSTIKDFGNYLFLQDGNLASKEQFIAAVAAIPANADFTFTPKSPLYRALDMTYNRFVKFHEIFYAETAEHLGKGKKPIFGSTLAESPALGLARKIPGTENDKYKSGARQGQLKQDSDFEYRPEIILAMSVATALWIKEEAYGTLNLTKRDLANWFGLTERDVTNQQLSRFRNAGIPRQLVANKIGQRIWGTLGIKERTSASVNAKARIIQQLGQQALDIMERRGEVIMNTENFVEANIAFWGQLEFDRKQAEAKRKGRKLDNANFVTVKIKHITDPKTGFDIVDPTFADGTIQNGQFVGNGATAPFTLFPKLGEQIFGITSRVQEPLKEPKKVGDVVKTTSDGLSEITEEQQTAIDLEQQKPHYNNVGLMTFVKNLGREFLYPMMGYYDLTKSHVNNITGHTGANLGIENSIKNLEEHLEEFGSEPAYFVIGVDPDRRIRYRSNRFNPENNTLHRFMVSTTKDPIEVSTDPNSDTYKQFAIGIVLALELDGLDEKSPVGSHVKAFNKFVADGRLETAQRLVATIMDHTNSAAASKAKKELLEFMPHHNGHALMALFELSHFDSKKPTFETRLTVETDGVTNGSAIGFTQLAHAWGLGASSGAWSWLERMGIYRTKTPEGTASHTGFQNWKATGQDDSYQYMARNIVEFLEQLKSTPMQTAIEQVWGNLLVAEEDAEGNIVKDTNGKPVLVVTKPARDMMKQPFMIHSYGAGAVKILDEITVGFMNKLRENIEVAVLETDKAKQTKMFADLNRQIGVLSGRSINLTPTNALEFNLERNASGVQGVTFDTAIRRNVATFLKVPVSTALDSELGEFTRIRNLLNEAFRVQFKVFDIAYQKRLEEVKALNPGKALKKDQARRALKHVAYLLPGFQGAMTNTKAQQRIPVIKNGVAFGQDLNEEDIIRIYLNKVNTIPHTLSVNTTVGGSQTSKNVAFEGSKSVQGKVALKVFRDAGVSGAVLAIHSLDATVMQRTIARAKAEHGINIVNIWDAGVTNFKDSPTVARIYNEEFNKIMRDYNILEDVKSMMSASEESPELQAYIDEVGTTRDSRGTIKEVRYTSLNEFIQLLDEEITLNRQFKDEMYGQDLAIEQMVHAGGESQYQHKAQTPEEIAASRITFRVRHKSDILTEQEPTDGTSTNQNTNKKTKTSPVPTPQKSISGLNKLQKDPNDPIENLHEWLTAKLKRFPPEVLRLFNLPIVLKKGLTRFKGDKIVSGLYHIRSKQLFINPALNEGEWKGSKKPGLGHLNRTQYITHVLYHEMGHALDYGIVEKYGAMFSSKFGDAFLTRMRGLHDAATEGDIIYQYLHPIFGDEMYGKSPQLYPTEMFAQFFAWYIIDRTLLKENIPDMHDYMEKAYAYILGNTNEIPAPTDVEVSSSKPKVRQGEVQTNTETLGPPESFDEITLNSGGQRGGDLLFGNIATEFGLTKQNHYYSANARVPGGNVKLTEEQYAEGFAKVKEVADSGYHNLPASTYVQGLLTRNWFQVKDSTQIIGVAPLSNNKVQGGTGWAFQMALLDSTNQRQLDVFNTNDNTWYQYDWNQQQFVKTDTAPTLHRSFGGIGSRQDIGGVKGAVSNESDAAIRDVFQKTKDNFPKNNGGTGTSPTTPPAALTIGGASLLIKNGVKAALDAALAGEGIYTLRVGNANKEALAPLGLTPTQHYGNPWSASFGSADPTSGGLVKVSTVAIAVENYKDWLLGYEFEDFEQERRAWIMNQIATGQLDGKTLLYYTQLNEDSHADILVQLVNRRGTATSTPPLSGDINSTNIQDRDAEINANEFKSKTNPILLTPVNPKDVNGNPVIFRPSTDPSLEEGPENGWIIKINEDETAARTNSEQDIAIQAILDFVNDPDPKNNVFTLMGRGGTGKTTTMGKAIGLLGKQNTLYAPTYKAAAQLMISAQAQGDFRTVFTVAKGLSKKKNNKLGIFDDNPVAIRRALAKIAKSPDGTQDGQVMIGKEIIIIDEASMLSQAQIDSIQELIQKYTPDLNTKIIFMGDNAQIPPITDSTLPKAQQERERILSPDSPAFQYTKARLVARMRQAQGSPIIPLTDVIANNVEQHTLNEAQDTVTNPSETIAIGTDLRVSSMNNETNEGVVFTKPGDNVWDTWIQDYKANPQLTRLITFNNSLSKQNDSVGLLNDEARIRLFGENPLFLNKNESIALRSSVIAQHRSYNKSKDSVGGTAAKYTLKEVSLENGTEANILELTPPHDSELEHEYFAFNETTQRFHAQILELPRPVPIYDVVVQIGEEIYELKIPTEDGMLIVQEIAKEFEESGRFDEMGAVQQTFATLQYNYAINAHLAQGSTYRNVYVFEDNILGKGNPGSAKTKNQSLYVSMSRASNKLIMISSGNTLDEQKDVNFSAQVSASSANPPSFPEEAAENFAEYSDDDLRQQIQFAEDDLVEIDDDIIYLIRDTKFKSGRVIRIVKAGEDPRTSNPATYTASIQSFNKETSQFETSKRDGTVYPISLIHMDTKNDRHTSKIYERMQTVLGQFDTANNRIKALQAELDNRRDTKNPPPWDTLQSSDRQVNTRDFVAEHQEDITSDNLDNIFNNLVTHDTGTNSAEHITYLQSLLNTLLNKAIKPLDGLILKTKSDQNGAFGAIDGHSIYMNNNPVRMTSSEQTAPEVFVHELLHGISKEAIDSDPVLRRKLQRLFEVADANTTWKDFLKKDAQGNVIYLHDQAAEEAEARRLYNYVFAHQTSYDKNGRPRNNTLHEFFTFAMSNQQMVEHFRTIKETRTRKYNRGESLLDSFLSFIEDILAWLVSTTNNTKGDNIQAEIDNIAHSIIAVERNGFLKMINMLETGFLYSRKPLDITVGALAKLYANMFAMARTGKPSANPEKFFSFIPNFFKTSANIIAYEQDLAAHPEGRRIEAFVTETRHKALAALTSEEGVLRKTMNTVLNRSAEFETWHRLLRHSKHAIDQLRKNVSEVIQREVTRRWSIPLDANESKAITQAFIQGDIDALMDDYTIEEVSQLLSNSQYRKDQIKKVKKNLFKKLSRKEQKTLENQALGLASMMIHGYTKTYNQSLNADQILFEFGKRDISPELDTYISLLAMDTQQSDTRKLAVRVIKRELASGKKNGITHIQAQHKAFKELSKDRLFENDPMLIQKGYMAEIYDQSIDVKIAPLKDKAILDAEGYVLKTSLRDDFTAPTGVPMGLYVAHNNPNTQRVKSIVSVVNMIAQGTTLAQAQRASGEGYQKVRDALQVHKTRQIYSTHAANGSVSEDKLLVPIKNRDGKIVNYRYMMNDLLRHEYLNKEYDIAKVMGQMHASIESKANSTSINSQVIKHLYQDYKDNYNDKPDSFIKMSNDPKNKYHETFKLMPAEMRIEAENLFGKEQGVYVRAELVEFIFGFRKASLANVSAIKGTQFARLVSIIENGWQQFIAQEKVNIVIKTIDVMVNNIISNTILLSVLGVPLSNILKDSKEAVISMNAYQKDFEKLLVLQRELKGDSALQNDKRFTARISRIQQDLAVNPVSPLIDEGIFQSITEDIDADQYGDKTKLINWLNDTVGKGLPGFIRKGLEYSYLSENTSAFKLLMKVTQYSDFTARYTLWKHEKRKGRTDDRQIILEIMNTFINYDIPDNKYLQYANDIGLLMFTKFSLRIQHVITRLATKNTANFITSIGAQQVLGQVSDVADSSVLVGGLWHTMHLNPVDHVVNAVSPYGLVLLSDIVN